MSRSFQSVLCAALTVFALSAVAQDKAPAAVPAVKSVNIQDVKPDASDAPGYAEQTNAERGKVQPGNNAPMWRGVGAGAEGYTSLPKADAPEAGVLIQPFVQYPGSRLTTAGEAWRQVRNNWIIPYGGSLLLIALGAVALFYWRKGMIMLHGKPTGVEIERFTPFERSAHWTNAIAFVVLAVSGIFMAFGKFFIQPIIGDTLFGFITYLLKNAHNFAGPLFAVSLTVVFFTFLKDNWPSKEDWAWIIKAGGLFGSQEVPSHRFNAGEKVVFWAGVFGLGLIVVASGLVLDMVIPFLGYERGMMQVAHMVHAVATVLMMAMFIGHIYMGTVGMEGAFKAMKTGYVDETWAKEHHELWHDDIKAGKIPAHRTDEKSGTTARA
ncbi:MAG: formate dehydrogenase subunit gamma [Burkholderiales bacterium 35-55-47]|jgi:formate dehydrogenase subunit gamma|uniref:formate dehydrogenase subunit gamma n=1 Tax=Limnohabitans sp. TaxID=1907725 RepID=UPI000BCCDDB6|nr:formate dehydrogenase subunit gamma [Limnohabitans sp.]OYY20255.1 MAG: formate dehydrogenase subunit gamma [Burkholderiales bacterium 35-55-47]OYZ74133.1 MAG: formate dehydrogenase subunit gamma [Burkholderiales bacterium 24-55-52]OZB01975.1 MAG: formate dehydrogenase subunit gamma [Burkholderiales bacterium 39-55-53]HQR86507.1 formate dehydrogenase subunit gamma [Limnohabitans sp.]HQS28076.1 formate dehydrogenase subunit gamma [Limnohabitans sp.]